MKNTPARPLRSEFLSLLLTSEEGSTISNAPKKEAAKIMKTTKNTRFGSQWVDSQLKMSAVTLSPPTSQVMAMMREIGTVYRSTMKSPYMAALKRPAALLPWPLTKNDMVIGTIGKTHGVRSIANPQSMASRMRAQREPLPLCLAGACACASF